MGDHIVSDYMNVENNILFVECNWPHDVSGADLTMAGDITSDESNYGDISVFAFGNGPGPYYDLSDNGTAVTTAVSASEIGGWTYGYSSIHFAWQWTCASARYCSQPSMNFSNAWTSNKAISVTGFDYGDNTGYCFIGFEGQAPMIGNAGDCVEGYNGVLYPFIQDFYDAATSGHTVHDALNIASLNFFGEPYDQSPLIAYSSYFPVNETGMPAGWYGGMMMVFGDSNIYIVPVVPETVSAPSVSGSTSDNIVDLTVSSTDNKGNPVAYLIDWGDGTDATLYTNGGSDYPSGQWASIPSYSYGSSGQYTITVSAESSDGVWSSPSTYTVNIDVPTYQTEVDVYVTWDGVNGYYYGTYYINEPAGWNDLDFASGFIEAYDYFDSSYHTTNPDWYDLGTGTTIDVCYWA